MRASLRSALIGIVAGVIAASIAVEYYQQVNPPIEVGPTATVVNPNQIMDCIVFDDFESGPVFCAQMGSDAVQAQGHPYWFKHGTRDHWSQVVYGDNRVWCCATCEGEPPCPYKSTRVECDEAQMRCAEKRRNGGS